MNKRLRFNLIIVMVILFCSYAITGISIFSLSGIGLLTLLLITGTVNDDFIVMQTGAVIAPLIVISGNNIFFAFSLFASLKLLFKNINKPFKVWGFYFALTLIFLEIVGDFGNVSTGMFLYVFSMLIYFLVFILLYDISKLNITEMKKVIIVTMLISVFFMIIGSGGDLARYISSSDNSVRLGESTRSLGGSMGLPIYCLLILSMILSEHINNKPYKNFVVYLIALFVFVIGFLSISRVYILGLLIILFCLVLSLFYRTRRRSVKLLLTIFSIGSIYIYNNIGSILELSNRFLFRSSGVGFSTGRSSIYLDIFRFLGDNFKALLLGSGAINYAQVGSNEGYLFSMMAHNLYLDLIMSWGIIGFIAIAYLIKVFSKNCKSTFKTKPNIISLMPAIVLIGVYMTAGTFSFFSIYIYIIIYTIFAYENVVHSNRINEVVMNHEKNINCRI